MFANSILAFENKFSSFFNLAENQSVDWLKTHGDNTFVSNVSSSPLQPLKAAGTQKRESNPMHDQLRLIEEVKILQDDSAGRRSTVSNK